MSNSYFKLEILTKHAITVKIPSLIDYSINWNIIRDCANVAYVILSDMIITETFFTNQIFTDIIIIVNALMAALEFSYNFCNNLNFKDFCTIFCMKIITTCVYKILLMAIILKIVLENEEITPCNRINNICKAFSERCFSKTTNQRLQLAHFMPHIEV